MEINEFVGQLKGKYGYSDEMEQFLQKAIPAIITYYGEDKRDIILAALSECEIHIQKEGENTEQYLNDYFGKNKKWDMPFLASAFQHTELSLTNNQVSQKNIIYVKTNFFHGYSRFDFNDEGKISTLIHEMCHLVKGYGNLKVEDGKIVGLSGLAKSYYEYDKETNSFVEVKTDNIGLEEALNSYDEASVMTIMTGKFHEFGTYKGMSTVARELMKHEELSQIIKKSQFSGETEWIDFLGEENSRYLSKNFDDWVSVLYSSPSELLDERQNIIEKGKNAAKNVMSFAKNYTTSKEVQSFIESRKMADQKTLDTIEQTILYNRKDNSFEEVMGQTIRQS